TRVPTAGVYRSTDEGATWGSTVPSGPFYASPYGINTAEIRVSISPADPQTLWVYSGDNTRPYANSTLAVINVNDGSIKSWSAGPASIDSSQFSYNTYIAADPEQPSTAYIGNRDVYKVTRNADDTLTWTNLTGNLAYSNGSWIGTNHRLAHVDQHSIAFS